MKPVTAALALALCALPAFAELDLAGAAEQGQWAQVRSLIQSGDATAEINQTQADGMTALHWAVQANMEDVVRQLLDAGADPNVANRYGITPLWLAAQNGSPEVVEALLKAGADAIFQMEHGETALMTAARTGDPESVRLLIEAGADPNVAETTQGETALMWAAAEDHAEAVSALIEGGANPDQKSYTLELAPMEWQNVGMVSTVLPRGGWTALMYAARQNARNAAAALARMGADLNAKDPDGATALETALMNEHYDFAAQLLDAGADPNAADLAGVAAVYSAVDMHNFPGREIGRPPRPHDDQHDALDVLRLALAKGGDPNATLSGATIARHHGFPDRSLAKGGTPLIRAAKSSDVEAMQILLDAGADPTQTMEDGTTAIMMIAGGRLGPAPDAIDKPAAAIRLLVEHGADLDARNEEGETAAHRAGRAKSKPMLALLTELGADMALTDNEGQTAQQLADAKGNGRDRVSALRNAGVKPVGEKTAKVGEK